jgi:hypothetical protein
MNRDLQGFAAIVGIIGFFCVAFEYAGIGVLLMGVSAIGFYAAKKH